MDNFPVGETRPNDVQSGGHHSRILGYRGRKRSLIFPVRGDTCRGDHGTNHCGENNYDDSVKLGFNFYQ